MPRGGRPDFLRSFRSKTHQAHVRGGRRSRRSHCAAMSCAWTLLFPVSLSSGRRCCTSVLVTTALLLSCQGSTSRPHRLDALLGREDGLLYFSETGIIRSPTASWVLRSVSSLESAYARLQMLLTPTKFKAVTQAHVWAKREFGLRFAYPKHNSACNTPARTNYETGQFPVHGYYNRCCTARH